jgi:two-component system, chemotaxis family, response regulator Rcp1
MSSFRVVLVEDNPADVFLVREALRAQEIDFSLTCYADIPEAMRGLSDESVVPPDVLLLDLNLPRGDALQLLTVLREFPRFATVPIAVLTSSQSPRDREEAARMGVQSFINKPPSLDEFLQQVGGAVAGLLAAA